MAEYGALTITSPLTKEITRKYIKMLERMFVFSGAHFKLVIYAMKYLTERLEPTSSGANIKKLPDDQANSPGLNFHARGSGRIFLLVVIALARGFFSGFVPMVPQYVLESRGLCRTIGTRAGVGVRIIYTRLRVKPVS